MDREPWLGAIYGVAKSRTGLGDFTFTFHIHALEKEMAAYFSVLAWRIPWTEEPGGLQTPTDCSPPWDYPSENTGEGCHFLLQGVSPTQGSNLCRLHWQAHYLPLSHQGSSAGLKPYLQNLVGAGVGHQNTQTGAQEVGKIRKAPAYSFPASPAPMLQIGRAHV